MQLIDYNHIMSAIKLIFQSLCGALLVSCVTTPVPMDKTITFSLIVVGEKPFIRQSPHVSDSLVVDSMRVVQIVNDEIFLEKLDMDWYVFHIDNIVYQGDSLIRFTVDKEALGGYLSFDDYKSNKTPIKWGEIQSRLSEDGQIVSIRKKDNYFWTLDYGEKIIDAHRVINNKDIEASGLPILLYESEG